MTGPEHYREAERLLRQASDQDNDGNRYFLADSECDLAAAQVHATLALAAAQAYPAVAAYIGDEHGLWVEQREWANATAPKAPVSS
jgi:hypothetical protein